MFGVYACNRKAPVEVVELYTIIEFVLFFPTSTFVLSDTIDGGAFKTHRLKPFNSESADGYFDLPPLCNYYYESHGWENASNRRAVFGVSKSIRTLGSVTFTITYRLITYWPGRASPYSVQQESPTDFSDELNTIRHREPKRFRPK